MNPSQSFKELTEILTETKKFQVLKQFEKIDYYNTENNEPKLIGIFIDIETTGLNFQVDKIIELALVPFEFTKDGRIYRVLNGYCSFQDPGIDIPGFITSLSGITDEMVKGQSIDVNRIKELISNSSIIIAHNAEFDRKFIEKQYPFFAEKAWACSYSQIPWISEGINNAKLEYLAYKFGFFYEAHRAEIDCFVGIHLLTMSLPLSKNLVLQILLDNARLSTYRIWAANIPFNSKNSLKARGYSWNDGSNNMKPRSWYIEVSEELKNEEINFLHNEIYKSKVSITIEKVNAFNRFSNRI